MPHRFLVACSETDAQQAERREAVGASAAEGYGAVLKRLAPDARCETISCVDGRSRPDAPALAGFDAVFFSGSPIQMHEESAEARRAEEFMREVFASGTPAFGSCAGLQIAAVAAGGTTKPRQPRIEAGFARGIVSTEAGRSHPLLGGRSISWDAFAMHSSEIDRLPDGATVLARTRSTPVQAAEIRFGRGVFWGVQYHPELTGTEIAAALKRSASEIVSAGLANNRAQLEEHAERIADLDAGEEPRRRSVWMLGLDREILDPSRRTTEIANFIRFVTTNAGADGGRSVAAAVA